MMIAFIIVVIHFIADFIFQAEEWATNKSKNIVPLVSGRRLCFKIRKVKWRWANRLWAIGVK